MVWHIMRIYEDDKEIHIAYSCETNDNCDGTLIYNKETEEIDIKKFSEGASELATKRGFGPIRYLLEKEGITEKKRRIATG